MPTWLKGPRWNKVDFVDRPADAHAQMMIWKRDDTTPDPEGEQVTGEPTGEAQSDKKEGGMPKQLSEEVLKSLPQEVQELISSLRQQVEEGSGEGAAPPDVDVTKRDDLPEDVRAAIAKRDAEIAALQKSADEANEIAKAERDTRIRSEVAKRVDALDQLRFEEDVDAVGLFKRLRETDEALYEGVLKALDAANAQIDSAELFREIGHGAGPDSTIGKMESVVKGIMDSDKVDEPEAWSIAMEREPDLYATYRKEA